MAFTALSRFSLLAVPLLLLLLPAPASAQKHISIGDSITAGSSWPSGCGICPVVFDCTGNCGASSGGREKCGYARRLDDWLGAGDQVVNLGVGAESTAEAMSRLASELNSNCGTPGACTNVILMHGSNDMEGSVSPESARDNLAAMIDEAKSRNIDVLLMTIIRRVYDKDNEKWSTYRGFILDLASSENLQSVDPWTPLCDSFKCFNEKYWVDREESQCTDPGEGDSAGSHGVGHVDPDGYGVMTDLIQDVFPGSAPAAPSPTSPSGVVADTTPDFVWPQDPEARWYQLEVDGAETWWESAESCSGSTCTVNTGVSYAAGAHSWRVRGRNLRGQGTWSADIDFSLTAPAAPTPIGPTGELFESAPDYRWLEVEGATEYDLEVRDAADNLDAGATGLLASAVCDGGVCSYVEGTVLTGDDDYTLKVLGRNGVGDGPLSPGLDFSILDCVDASQKALAEFVSSPVTTTETIEHCGLLTGAATGAYTIEVGGDLTVHTRDGFAAHNGLTVRGKLAIKNP